MPGERKEHPKGFRWWLFKKISRFGWWVCPEPHKTRLYQSMSFDTAMWKERLPHLGARHD